MKYEVILFDADGTLFDFDKAEEYALEKALLFFHIDYEKEHLKHYRDVNKAIWAEFENELITVEDLKTERFRRYFVRVGLELEPIDFSKYYMNYLSEAHFLLEGAMDLLTYLHKKYKLVLITNGLSTIQRSRLKLSSLNQFFDHIVISEEIGISKPNAGIFEHSLKLVHHSNKHTALMVGDNLKSDILGGINFGIDTCWFNPTSTGNTSHIQPTYEIHDLLQLKEILA